jgi:hypothetical protein
MVIEHPEQYTGWTAAAFGSAPGIRADRRGRGARQLLRARCAALLSFLANASRAWRGEVLRKPGQRANSGPPCVFLAALSVQEDPLPFLARINAMTPAPIISKAAGRGTTIIFSVFTVNREFGIFSRRV